jgi:DNA-binding NtrC family response regulator
MKKEGKPILVVEDDLELCNAILATLHRSSYLPVGVVELREAMFKLKNQTFACVILDMRLKNDSGEDLVDFIRERKDVPNHDTPILVISGFLDKKILENIGKQIQGALVKPFEMSSLLEMLEKHTKNWVAKV